jgi:hypothetical protein
MNQLDHFFPFLKENILFFDPDESMKLSLKLRGTIIPRYQIKNSFFTVFPLKAVKPGTPTFILPERPYWRMPVLKRKFFPDSIPRIF